VFSENWRAFERAFASISDAYAKLEDVGLYIDSDLAGKVIVTLAKINAFYRKKHAEMGQAHDKALQKLDGKALKNKDVIFDFEAFHHSMLREWNFETQQLRQELKDELRAVLQPSSD